jgi:histidine ammonia-lyase
MMAIGGSMTRKLDTPEPLLTAVARKLGQAAGTLANMTHRLTAEPITTESRSPSKPESVDPTPSRPSSEEHESSAGGSRNRKTSQRHATPQKRTHAAGTRTKQNPTGKKKVSGRKK